MKSGQSGTGGLLTPQEVADVLRVTRRTVYGWLRSGQLQGSKIGTRDWRISQRQVDDFLYNRGSMTAGAQQSLGEQKRPFARPSQSKKGGRRA